MRMHLARLRWPILVVAGLALALGAAGIASAGDQVRICVNDREVELDVPARVVNGRTVAPVRWIAEALGAEVEWDENSRTVYITSAKTPEALLGRLRALEPDEPERVEDDWIGEMVKRFVDENGLSSLEDIRSGGRRVPFEVTSQDDEWIRPVYSRHWHSTFMGGKFANVERLISYARRHVFVYSGGLSEGSWLYCSLGFDEDWAKPVGSTFDSNKAFELWLVSCRALEVRRLGREWLVIVEPALAGYQTVRIDYPDAGIRTDGAEGRQFMCFALPHRTGTS